MRVLPYGARAAMVDFDEQSDVRSPPTAAPPP